MTRKLDMTTNDFVDAAEALQMWFRHQDIKPAEAMLVFALLQAMWMRDARREGKTANVDIYTKSYHRSLSLWDDFVAAALKEKD